MTEPLIQNVSDTAYLVATYRAMEGEREGALFHDPLGARLAGERGRAIAASLPKGQFARWAVAVRTVVIDELVEGAISRGVDTVLNLGAGLDTRPYRMKLPASLRWVEADFPDLIASKDRTLANEAPNCRLERVGLDLRDRAARRALLERVSAATKAMLVLTEGVVPYLELHDVAELADDLYACASIRGWIVDYFSPRMLRLHQRFGRKTVMKNAPFRFEPADWIGFFAEHGFAMREMRYIVGEARRLGRPPPLSRILLFAMRIGGLFLGRERREALRKLVGYALLEPKPRAS